MKILVLGDIHCKPNLLFMAREIFLKRKCDYLVFLGDACDNFGATQDDNMQIVEDLAQAKAELGEQFVWLIGNHDWGYFHGDNMTGHIHERESLVQHQFAEHLEDWEVVAKIGKYVFSHAGIGAAFAKEYGGHNVIENIKALKKVQNTYNPLDNVGIVCGGYSYKPSPIWIRPQEFGEPWGVGEIVQIVGHTPVEKIAGDKNVVVCDTFSQYPNKTFIGDRSLLLIEDEKMTAISIDTNRKLYEVKL